MLRSPAGKKLLLSSVLAGRMSTGVVFVSLRELIKLLIAQSEEEAKTSDGSREVGELPVGLLVLDRTLFAVGTPQKAEIAPGMERGFVAVVFVRFLGIL